MKIQLFAGGKREKVSKEKAQALVERWTRELEGKDGASCVDISCLSWTQEAFEIIQPFLEKIAPHVKYCNFADIIAGLMTEEGLAVTESLARTFAKAPLSDIDLSDNAMGPRGLIRVESMIANAPLQRLYLSNCGLSSESMEYLLNWFTADNNRIASNMKVLVIDRNMLGTAGAEVVGKIIGHCPKLEYFSYLGCRTQEGTMYLANGLKTMVKSTDRHPLRRLELDDCNFGEEDDPAYVPLAEALEGCSQMRHLDLTDAKLETEGLEKVLGALSTAEVGLTHLGLDGGGEFGEEGAKILAKFLETQATTLTCLKCSFNELGDSAVPILLEPFGALRCPLVELHLECNELEKESLNALVRANLPCLKKLNVVDNDELPKRHLRKKYGDVLVVGDDDDEEEDEEEGDNTDIDELILGFKNTKLT